MSTKFKPKKVKTSRGKTIWVVVSKEGLAYGIWGRFSTKTAAMSKISELERGM